MSTHNGSKRKFIKAVAYTAPAIISLKAEASFGRSGSDIQRCDGGKSGGHSYGGGKSRGSSYGGGKSGGHSYGGGKSRGSSYGGGKSHS